MSGEKLKPCPFCGSDRIVPRDRNEHCDYFLLYCHSCNAEGPNGRTLDEAIAAWNRRAVPADVREAAERILKARAAVAEWQRDPLIGLNDAETIARHILGVR